MWIDVHAHLDRLSGESLAGIIDKARQAGVSIILSTATDLESAIAVVRQCERFPGLFGAVGISPFDTLSQPDNWQLQLRSLLDQERIIAAGEIGLDHSNPRYPPIEKQLPFFEKQLGIAMECGKPAIIHSRGAEKRAVEICRSLGVRKALFHCFTGSSDALRQVIDSGYYISFSGIITFSSAVRELIPAVPLDRLFIETDTPYLAPVPHRGKTNSPEWVGIVGSTVAKVKGIAIERLQQALRDNCEQLFFRK